MNLFCDLSLANGYKSASQQARVLSESWFASNAYCLACDSSSVQRTSANTRATDFVCSTCSHRYELKTFRRRPRGRLVDGAFDSMMQRVQQGTAPTLCLLERSDNWKINALTAIHSSFLIPEVVERRRPLGPKAKRAGWVGCNIRLNLIPIDGEISVVSGGIVHSFCDVRTRFQRFLPLAEESASQRGWTLLTLRMVRRLKKSSFNLQDMYALEDEFARAYPENSHVRAKIRQQLQILRDLEVLSFEKRGTYKLLN